MKVFAKCLLVIALTAFSCLVTLAQHDDMNKFEFYGGYSWLNTDTGVDEFDPSLDSTFGSHGLEVSFTGNVHRYVGIKGDFSHHSKTETFIDAGDNLDVNVSTTQFLGGVQFKNNMIEGSRFRPFAHILAGLAHQSIALDGVVTTPGGGGGGGRPFGLGTPINVETSANNFAMAFGGGVDIKINHHFSIRAIQVDYNPIFFRDQNVGTITIPGQTQNNFRLGAGVVIN
jgi:opacity protein-like surface antigen